MSLSSLSKEQKQYLLLGVIVTAALTILIVFGVKVSLSSISEARLDLYELSTKIESADRSVSRNELTQDEYRATIAELGTYLETIPPDRNYYSWATELIYDEARAVFFEIEAVDEIVMPEPAEVTVERDQVEMESYALRITARGGYESVKQFLGRIAENHPLVRVTGVEISTGADPAVHDVQLFIEWPFNMGYITESWGSISDDSAESDTEKMPTPPPPRAGSGPESATGTPAQSEPIA